MFTALIPVKEFRLAKKRLSSLLRPEERYQLAAAMLLDILDLAACVPSVVDIVVVTADPVAQGLARAHGTRIFEETAPAGLNAALDQAAAKLAGEGVSRVMILPTDIGFAAPGDLTALAETHRSLGLGSTIAAARFDFGTNCLLVTPPNAIPFCFGELSSIRHFENAKRRGHNAEIRRVPGLDRDIDHVADLRAFCAAAPPRRSLSYLKKNGALQRILAPCPMRQDLV